MVACGDLESLVQANELTRRSAVRVDSNFGGYFRCIVSTESRKRSRGGTIKGGDQEKYRGFEDLVDRLNVGVGDWSLIRRSNVRLVILEYCLYSTGERRVSTLLWCMRRFERWDGGGMGVAYGVTAWLRAASR